MPKGIPRLKVWRFLPRSQAKLFVWRGAFGLMIPAILATLLFCISAVTANRATRLAGSIEANFWRLLLASVLLGGWAHSFGSGWGGSAWGIFFASGVVGFGIGDLALYLSYPRLGSRLTLLLTHCLAAPLAAVCEWIWLGTTLRWAEIVAVGSILTGVCLALTPTENLHLDKRTLAVGTAWGVLAAMGQGIGAVMSRVGYAANLRDGFDMDGMSVAYQRILGGLAIGAASFVWINGRKPAESAGWIRMPLPPTKSFSWIVITGLTGPTFGVACYQWALEHTPSGIVLSIVATAPLAVMPITFWMEGDRPGKRAFIGGLLAVLGVIALGWA